MSYYTVTIRNHGEIFLNSYFFWRFDDEKGELELTKFVKDYVKVLSTQKGRKLLVTVKRLKYIDSAIVELQVKRFNEKNPHLTEELYSFNTTLSLLRDSCTQRERREAS